MTFARSSAGHAAVFERVSADGVQIEVTRWGRGAPVLCLSAIGHDARDFEALASLCSNHYEVIALDWPGQGRSGSDSHPVSAARYADLAERALDSLGVGQPVVIGNSIGGAVAIHLAARGRVSALVLCNPGGLAPVNAMTRLYCRAFEAFFRSGERGASWYPGMFAQYYRLVLPAPSARTRRAEIVADARRIAPVLRQAWASFGHRDADVRELAAGLDIPIWVAWAKRDRVIPFSFCRPAIAKLRRAHVTFFDAGHSAFLEQPEGFAVGFEAFTRKFQLIR